ncbi:head-tail connector protein [Noviherbaspirillum galbum]|uniref:Phage gp6-like head-tail connector protein n=1 Tax=Noviherbaspirillum galbum TaxID=2709383 RepID=A0A6B3SR95_9BURK|nr:head-tail connector protein [Noviherbaspirillum galbum]NEX63450.1 phage gp6-like head-tail connector protein [Noviherbaspirillum galbum]
MITLDEAKNFIRVDDNADDDLILGMIATAKAHVENYTGETYADGEVPAPIKSAALLLIGELYDNRGIQYNEAIYTSRTFANLLNQYRKLGI